NGSLAQFTDRTVTTKLGPPILAEEPIESVCETSDGALWFGNRQGLVRWKDGAQRLFTQADGLPSDRVYAAVPARAGGLWVGTDQGLVRFRDGRIEHPVREPVQAFSVFEDANGVVWVG